MELLRITRQIHCKAVEQRATDNTTGTGGTSYSRPPIDPYLTSPPVTKSRRRQKKQNKTKRKGVSTKRRTRSTVDGVDVERVRSATRDVVVSCARNAARGGQLTVSTERAATPALAAVLHNTPAARGPIYKISCDYLAIMPPELRSTYS